MKSGNIFWVSTLLWVLLVSNSQAQTPPCDSDPTCKQKAEAYFNYFKSILLPLGFFPTIAEEQKQKVDLLKKEKPTEYKKIQSKLEEYKNWSKDNTVRKEYFYFLIEDFGNEALLDWFNYFVKQNSDAGFLSTEFCKGWGLHTDLNMGGAGLFTNREAYSSSARMLLSYTFKGKTDGGGRFRFLFGPSLYYQARTTYLLGNARLEVRLKDLGNALTNLGNLKLILQSSVNEVMLTAGAGLGIELSNFGVQLTSDYQRLSAVNNYLVQFGLFYRFLITEKK